MKRLHIHIAVDKLSESIGFYSTIFGAEPAVEREDYAKWKLTDPAVNFAISKRGQALGLNHLGIQVDSENELAEIEQRLSEAQIASTKQEGASCCYANSNKHWAMDPTGIAWESFHTLGEIEVFGEDTVEGDESSACCVPPTPSQGNAESTGCCVPTENKGGGCC